MRRDYGRVPRSCEDLFFNIPTRDQSTELRVGAPGDELDFVGHLIEHGWYWVRLREGGRIFERLFHETAPDSVVGQSNVSSSEKMIRRAGAIANTGYE
jgi:hypothetical protein